MYHFSEEKLGTYRLLKVLDANTGNGFSLAPEVGATLLTLSFGGLQVLDTYSTEDELTALAWMKNILLFPFPNRLDGGQYIWEGQSFRFPINNADTENALHGFAFAEKFALQQVTLAENWATVTCRMDYDGYLAAYPFPCCLAVTFKISNQHRFSIKIKVQNTGTTALPMGLGWHPYFRLSESVSTTTLKMPELALVAINERMLPTGVTNKFNEFITEKNIGSIFLDNCFKINSLQKKWKIRIAAENHSIELRAKARDWQYVQIFTPPHRASVALEPMTCNIDAFNSGEGLLRLASGQTWSSGFEVAYQNKQKK